MNTSVISSAADREAVQRFQGSNDAMSFRLLYKRYASKVYRKCLGFFKEEALAKDATQEIFIRVFLHLPQFRQEARFSSWLFRITHNYCLDYLRRRKEQLLPLTVEGERVAAVPEEKPEASPLDRKMAELNAVLEQLPRQDRAILIMKFDDQLSIKEIARIMDLSESAVKMRIKRAKAKAQRLRAQLANKGART